MSLVGGWLLAPAVLTITCLALGLLAERLIGRALPGALIPALGLGALIVTTGILTTWSLTAHLALPFVVAATVGSIAWLRPWRDPRLRRAWPWPAVVAAGAYAIYALPSLWSGQGSIAGYVKLDDSATWILLTDRVFSHGHDLSGLPQSSIEATLQTWLGSGYPTGAFMPLGVAGRLSGQDLVNAYQPTIAVMAAILALGLYAAVRELVPSAGRATACALVGVQASLLFGYAQWGGIKEAVTVALLPALAVLAARGEALAAALVAGALLDVLGLGGIAWAGPGLIVAAVAVRRVAPLAIAAGVFVLAAVPALAQLEFVRQTTDGAITAQNELGNLVRPLPLLQGAGLWPSGDFRIDTDPRSIGVIGSVLVVAAAAVAVGLALRSRRYVVPALVGVALAGTTVAVVAGSPWVDAKALAIASPFVMTAAATLLARRAVALALLAGAVAWSTVLVARDVYVAPRERLAELRSFAPAVAGKGPTLVLDFDVYADRWFLRAGDPEGVSDLRRRLVPLTTGQPAARLATVDVDDVALPGLWDYRSLARRRTPVGSRPPAAFTRVRAGDYWEVWRRDRTAPAPLARMPLGTGVDPVAKPVCSAIGALASTPGARVLAAVPRTRPLVVDLDRGGVPPPWRTPDGIRPLVDGVAAIPVRVPTAGRWRVWVGGSSLGRLEVRVRGQSLGVHRHVLAHGGQWQRFDTVALPAGVAVIEIRYSRGHRAGRGTDATQSPLGPLALTRVADDAAPPVVRIAPSQYRRLCDGRTYDWIEALR